MCIKPRFLVCNSAYNEYAELHTFKYNLLKIICKYALIKALFKYASMHARPIHLHEKKGIYYGQNHRYSTRQLTSED